MEHGEPSSSHAHARSVVRRLTEAGHRALFAGGCVRDRLMGRAPKDHDVATSATPEKVLALFPRAIPVGAAFGVVRVLSDAPSPERGGAPPPHVEVATFRREWGYADGRHPGRVQFCDEKEDVKRRDFTVNGLLYDPLQDEVLDYVGGRSDLEAKLVRAIGDPRARFREDRLRLLRAVRFAAELDFEIEPATRAAIEEEAARVTEVSPERLMDELAKILTGPDPRRAFRLLRATGLLNVLLPEVNALAGVPQPPEYHPEGDVWVHTLLLLGQLRQAPLPLALGALLHDIGKPPTFTRTDRIRFNEHDRVGAELTGAILKRFRCSRELSARVTALVRQHMVFKDAPRMRPATLKRFLRQPHFEDHLALHKLDCLASHGKLDTYDFCRAQRARLSEDDLRPPPLLRGGDLLALGLAPGPLLGTILSDVEERQLEGTLSSTDEALAYVRARYLGALEK